MIAGGSSRAAAEARADQDRELDRYGADLLAARAPLRTCLGAGALAGLTVYLVPIAVVAGSFVLQWLVYAAVVPPAQLVLRLFGWGVYRADRGAPGVATPAAGPSAAATPLPAIESGAEGISDAAWLTATALIVFWPVALAAIGAAMGALYRARRRRAEPALARAPIDVPIALEVGAFYALTAATGLVARVGTFVALGANLVFAWAGYIVWRWTFDRLLRRLAPPAVRAGVLADVARERDYRHRLRESG